MPNGVQGRWGRSFALHHLRRAGRTALPILADHKVPSVLMNPVRGARGVARALRPPNDVLMSKFTQAIDRAVARTKAGNRITIGDFSNLILGIVAPRVATSCVTSPPVVGAVVRIGRIRRLDLPLLRVPGSEGLQHCERVREGRGGEGSSLTSAEAGPVPSSRKHSRHARTARSGASGGHPTPERRMARTTPSWRTVPIAGSTRPSDMPST